MVLTLTQDQVDTAGSVAYAAYVDAAGGRSVITGEELPAWDDLLPAVRQAWRAAADATVTYAHNAGWTG